MLNTKRSGGNYHIFKRSNQLPMVVGLNIPTLARTILDGATDQVESASSNLKLRRPMNLDSVVKENEKSAVDDTQSNKELMTRSFDRRDDPIPQDKTTGIDVETQANKVDDMGY